MNSIAFPKMFEVSTTSVVKNKEASSQDVKILLACECGEFFGDPSFGVSIKKYIFDQNGYVLSDIIADEIFSKIKVFAPQLTVNRDDIKIKRKNDKLYASIKGINKVDFTTNMMEIAIFQDEER